MTFKRFPCPRRGGRDSLRSVKGVPVPHLIRIDWPHNGIPDLPPRAASTAAPSSLAAIRARIAGVVVALAIVLGPMADNGSIVQR